MARGQLENQVIWKLFRLRPYGEAGRMACALSLAVGDVGVAQQRQRQR
jgi:hypothetical protein